MTGNARFTSWFQMPATATASATAAGGNFHDRSIEYDAAIPTAAPAGETIESAVDACVIAIASRNPRPGKRGHPRRREGREVEDDRRPRAGASPASRACARRRARRGSSRTREGRRRRRPRRRRSSLRPRGAACASSSALAGASPCRPTSRRTYLRPPSIAQLGRSLMSRPRLVDHPRNRDRARRALLRPRRLRLRGRRAHARAERRAAALHERSDPWHRHRRRRPEPGHGERAGQAHEREQPLRAQVQLHRQGRAGAARRGRRLRGEVRRDRRRRAPSAAPCPTTPTRPSATARAARSS